MVIGADGLRSALRGQMLGGDTPRFTGQVAYRAVLEAEGAPPVAPGPTVWIGPGRHLVSYPLRGGRSVNVVAVEARNDWRCESWVEPGDPDALRRGFAGWCPEVAALLARVETCHLWALFDRAPLPRWSDGRVGLLGDACHPTLPFMAQGAAMAIEDAWVLADALEGRTPQDALKAYEFARKPRTSRLQNIARRNGALYHLSGPLGAAGVRARLGLARRLPAGLQLAPLDRVYGYDATRAVPPGDRGPGAFARRHVSPGR